MDILEKLPDPAGSCWKTDTFSFVNFPPRLLQFLGNAFIMALCGGMCIEVVDRGGFPLFPQSFPQPPADYG